MPFAKQTAIAEKIRESLQSGNVYPLGKLPSQTVLAADFGVSRLTMRRILRTLEAQGWIENRPELGGFVRGTTSSRSSTGTDWGKDHESPEAGQIEKVAGRVATIAADLKNRMLQQPEEEFETLLAGKPLRDQFGCSHRTLSRALSLLVHQGWIEPHGRSYRLAGGKAYGTGSHILLCGSPRALDSSHLPLSHSVRIIEQLLARQGWNPLLPYLSTDPTRLTPDFPARRVAGIILISRTRGWASYLMNFPKTPVVFLNPGEELLWKKGPPTSKLFHLHVDNRKVAGDMAMHLWRLGHRKAAFFHGEKFEAGSTGWLPSRLEGTRMVFAGIGKLKVFGPADAGTGTAVDTPRDFLDSPYTLKKRLEHLLPAEWINESSGFLYRMKDAGALALAMRPAFAQALKDREITAWVCANDSLAALALAYLRSRRVPSGRISLAGFDNSDLAFRLGITSVDFASESMGAAAVRCLTHPHLFSRRRVDDLIIQGTLVARTSTSRVGKGTIP